VQGAVPTLVGDKHGELAFRTKVPSAAMVAVGLNVAVLLREAASLTNNFASAFWIGGSTASFEALRLASMLVTPLYNAWPVFRATS